MKEFIWSEEKNDRLRKERGISFAELIVSRFVGIEGHHGRPHQKLMLFEFKGYMWVVPYVESEKHYFLKTAFPSRKHTKRYLKGD